jgi:uncharacterized protein involved in outer membrane biogenesis
MTRKRFFGLFFGILGAVLLFVVLYVAFGDLGRHKARIEALVTQTLGRPFVIEGPLKLRVFPVVDVSAEGVRLGNAPGGSQPQMIEIGKVVVQIGFWSLISGPPDVRLFELNDANVLLEHGSDGKGNWVMGPPVDEDADEEEEEFDEEGASQVPVIIRAAHLNNVRLVYRESKKTDRVVHLDKLSITPGQDELLALEGHGMLDVYPMVLKGEVGPLKSLLSARDMRIAMQGSLGKMALDIKGAVGSLDPLDGADLTLKLEHPELEGMLAKLELPAVGTGPLHISGQLKDVGALTQLDFDAKAADFTASVKGTLKTLSLAGGDLTLEVGHADVASLLKALELPVVVNGPMQIDTHIKDVGKLRQLDIDAKTADFTGSVKGTLKTRSLVGADLTLKVGHSDVGALLKALELPVIATGPMQIDTRIKDVGKRRQLDLKAKLGDLDASVKGTLTTRSLVGSDLTFEATAADAARLASVFEVNDVPAAPLKVSGHTVYSSKQLKFDALTAAIADASVRGDGTLELSGDRKLAVNFQLAAASLAKLRKTLPELKVSASGSFEHTKDRIELKGLQAALGENQLTGSLLLTGGAKHIEAQLSSPRLDLTPFLPPDKPPGTTSGAAPAAAPAKPEPPKKFVFDEKPLHFEKIKDTDAKVQLTIGELIFGERSVKDLNGNVHMEHGKISFDLRAAGAHEGTLQSAGTLAASGDGSADLELKIDVADLRASLGNKDIAREDVPPVSLSMDMKIHGSSARQLASGANGHLLFTQGAGKTKSGLIGAYGGGVLTELTQKLNPFAKDDPFMKLDCTIARADIVNGEVTVKPVVLQTEKVTISAHGNIDLRNEKMLIDFDTRPRKGIGVSPGMFTNPLIRLEGTLTSPRIGVGAKGMASGALAAATGGATVVAGGLVDRAKGEQDVCKQTLEEAKNPVTKEEKKK